MDPAVELRLQSFELANFGWVVAHEHRDPTDGPDCSPGRVRPAADHQRASHAKQDEKGQGVAQQVGLAREANKADQRQPVEREPTRSLSTLLWHCEGKHEKQQKQGRGEVIWLGRIIVWMPINIDQVEQCRGEFYWGSANQGVCSLSLGGVGR